MDDFLFGLVGGTGIAAFNAFITHRFFLRGESIANHLVYILRLILVVVAMVTAGRYGNLALMGTATGLLSFFPMNLWRAWRGK